MKKKLIITCSLITILLAGFPHVLYAEDVPQDFEGGYTTHYGNISELDNYFYENFILLPYLQSDSGQVINTGYKSSSSLKTDIYFSDISGPTNNWGIFGDNQNKYFAYFTKDNGQTHFRFNVDQYNYDFNFLDYYIYHVQYDQGEISLNDNLLVTYTGSFSTNENIYLFAIGPTTSKGYYKLYYFSIYDYSLNNGDGQLVRSFYPAKQKSNGSYGLYDAVNKIFYVSNSGIPFENPEGSDFELSLLSRIGLWLRTSLGSISEIFEYIVTEPMILFFLAVGLAGAMYRWARRLVHF